MPWRKMLAYITGTVDQELLHRIAGALENLGHRLCDETVGNILRRHGIPPAPEHQQGATWKEFIASHREV